MPTKIEMRYDGEYDHTLSRLFIGLLRLMGWKCSKSGVSQDSKGKQHFLVFEEAGWHSTPAKE